MTKVNLNNIRLNPLFRFLENEIQLKWELSVIATTFQQQPSDNRIIDNSISIDQGDVYLTSDQWETIYLYILKCQHVENHQHALQQENNLIDKDLLAKKISVVISNIHNDFSANAHIKNLKIIFNNKQDSTKFILLLTQSYILQAMRKNLRNTHDFKFLYTGACYHFGHMICRYFFSNYKKITKIVEAVSTDKYNSVSVDDKNEFYSYIESLLTNNPEQEAKFYSTWSNSVLTNRKFGSFIRLYFLYICYYSYYIDQLHEFPELFDLLKKYSNEYDIKILDVKMKDSYIQLGAAVLNQFEHLDIIKKETSKVSGFTDKFRTQVFLIFADDVIESLTDHLSINRPYLVAENADHLENKRHNDMLFSIAYQEKMSLVHSNLNMNLTVKETSYFSKEMLMTKVCIDTTFLRYFLELLDDILTKKDQSKQDVFMCLYDINISYLRSILNNQEDNEILSYIVDFAMDLNSTSNRELKMKMKYSSETGKQLLYEIIHKVTSYKIYIRGLLKDSVLYSDFRYFINTYFIDTRGRIYNNSVFLDNQTYHNAKMFVKFYRNDLYTQTFTKHYDKIRQIIANTLLFKEQKNRILEVTHKRYIELDTKLRYNYIYDFFDPKKISTERFKSLYTDDDIQSPETLQLLYSSLKKTKKLFIVQSYLLLERFPLSTVENYYEIDATCSGLQMVSILLNSNSLATLCNLTGNKKIDVYMFAANKFKTKLVDMNNLVDNFTSYHKIENADVFYDMLGSKSISVDKDMYLSCITPNERLIAFLRMDMPNSPYCYNLINSIGEDFNNTAFIIPQSYTDFFWLLSIQDIKHQENKTLKTSKIIFEYLMIMKKVIRFISILNQYKWINENNILHSRELFKKAIMTYFYNATSYGRKDDFEKFFFSHNQYIMKTKDNLSSIRYLATILDHYFIHFMLTEVPDSALMKQLSTYVSKQTKTIIINNKFFDIKFAPKKEATRIIQIASHNKKRGSQLTIREQTDELDSKAIRTSFTPNLIHSMDASIAHMFIERIVLANKHLMKEVEISFQLNHDTFGSFIRVFLKIILEDCYRELHQSNYINSLQNLEEKILEKIKLLGSKDILDLTKINPHFMK